MSSTHSRPGYGQAFVIAIILAALTVLEFYIALTIDSAVFLMLIAAIKAILVIRFFMHVNRLWAPEQE